jgi:type IV pilus assembly protein PilV
MNNRVAQRGFSLIEVLVSILVLALGVIGAAGMQLTALRTSQQSAIQTTALELATEMADKMRANDRAMKSDDSSNPFLGLDYATSVEPDVPGTLCYGKSANCDAGQLASFDIYEWKKHLRAALPAARAVICRDAKPWSSAAHGYKWECDASSTSAGAAPLTIKVGWQEKNPDGSLSRNRDQQFSPAIALVVEPYVQ